MHIFIDCDVENIGLHTRIDAELKLVYHKEKADQWAKDKKYSIKRDTEESVLFPLINGFLFKDSWLWFVSKS